MKQTSPAAMYAAPEIQYNPGPPRMVAPAGANSLAVMLGSGKPEPARHRLGPSGAIIAHGRPYIIDAGEGIWRAIANAAVAHNYFLAEALAPNQLTRLFITHLHSDHTVGLPSFILLPWIHGRSRSMEIHGPVGTARLVNTVLQAYAADIRERVHGPEQKDDTGWRVTVHEIAEPGFVYEDEYVRVNAFHHTHGTFAQNFGYQFQMAERTVVWAGDGVESDSYRRAVAGADVLFSDVGPVLEDLAGASWQQGDTALAEIFHISTRKLGELGTAGGVRQIVLHHEQNYFKNAGYDPQALVRDVKKYFAGDVFSARDGDVY